MLDDISRQRLKRDVWLPALELLPIAIDHARQPFADNELAQSLSELNPWAPGFQEILQPAISALVKQFKLIVEPDCIAGYFWRCRICRHPALEVDIQAPCGRFMTIFIRCHLGCGQSWRLSDYMESTK